MPPKSIWRAAAVTLALVTLSACSSTVEDTGGAPPKGTGEALYHSVLRSFDQNDPSALGKLFPTQSPATLNAFFQLCGTIDPAGRTDNLLATDGPQVLAADLAGISRNPPHVPQSCEFQLFWNQTARRWEIGANHIPSATPAGAPGSSPSP